MGWTMCFLLMTFSLAWTLTIICTSVYINIYNCVFGSLISDATCNYVSVDGGRDGLPFSGTGCPLPDIGNLCLLCIDLCLRCSFYFLPPPQDAFVHGLCLSNSGLNKLPWTSCLHAILRIISRVVSGLACDSSYGVWGRGWTTCLLHDSPPFGPHFKMRVGM